ncbi:MAG TPA: hypothetical protein VNT04_06060 [Gaiellaceae bacterium]|jgi:hypothetical protein|nr:hypothetical protein [Gaiellaceae bacterium]
MNFNKITKQMEDVDFDKIAQQVGEAAEHADKIAQQVGDVAERANEITQQVAEVAERVVENVSGAVRNGAKKGGHGARWLILPAVGAAVYAVAKNGSKFGRSTKALAGQAKDRASGIPDVDLLGRVKEVTRLGDDGQEDEVKPARARQGNSDARALEQRRRERAERRQRRRESTSTP